MHIAALYRKQPVTEKNQAYDHTQKLIKREIRVVFQWYMPYLSWKIIHKLTLQKPTFVLILAKYIVLCEVSAKGPASRIITYDLPFPPTENTRPSYLNIKYENVIRDSIYKQTYSTYIMETDYVGVLYLSSVHPRGSESFFVRST